MVLARDHDQAIGEHAFVRHAIRHRQQHVERDVEFAGGQVRFETRAVMPRGREAQTRSRGADGLAQFGQHAGFQRLAQADPEVPLGRRRFEPRSLAERALHRAERFPHRPRNRAGERGWSDPASLPLEQRLAEHVAQARERVTHGRLRQVQFAARGRDAACREDGVEHHEQVQVDPR